MTPRTPISDEQLREWLRTYASKDAVWVGEVVAEALARGERIGELERYVELLWRGSQGPITIAHVHGWRCPPELVEEGKRFRERLGLPDSYDDPTRPGLQEWHGENERHGPPHKGKG